MPELGTSLLQLARAAIASRFGAAPAQIPDLPELQEPGATFVTLMLRGDLRGCIGSLAATRPLAEDVMENARNAAFHDPRFPPLSPAEWADTSIEVSLLSPPEALHFKDEADAQAQLRPGVDGVVFTARGRRSTFLPQVWEQLPDPMDFMARLKMKAGLPPDHWGPEVRLERYQVRKWKENST